MLLRYLVLLVVISSLCGCRSPFYSDRGAVLGGVTGAGIGALIGEEEGNSGAGAAIGTAVGAATGALIGGEMDRNVARASALSAVAGNGVSTQDIVSMSQAGLGDQVIINHINGRGLVGPLEAYDLIALKQQGVSDRVIAAMQTPTMPPTVAVPVEVPPPVEVIPSIVIPTRRHCPPRRRRYRPGWNVSFGF